MTKKRWLAAIVLAALISLVVIAVFPSTRVTRASFCRLESGMTPGEVEAIFGEAPKPWKPIAGSDRGTEIRLMWAGEGTAQLLFHKDRGLVERVWTQPGFSSATKTSFDRVLIGMTVAEVTEILGKPTNPERWGPVKREDNAPPPEVLYGKWQDIDGCGFITFEKGRVRERFWAGGSVHAAPKRGFLFFIRRLLHLE